MDKNDADTNILTIYDEFIAGVIIIIMVIIIIIIIVEQLERTVHRCKFQENIAIIGIRRDARNQAKN